MDENEKDVVVPVVSEELHADAVPVVTGGVRVTKRVSSHDEILEQALRKSHAEVKRVAVNRVVDGPQPVQRIGNKLVIPVVSEVLRVEKQWVVTEEIHITQTEEVETVRQTVPVSHEEARIERLDRSGNARSENAEFGNSAALSEPPPDTAAPEPTPLTPPSRTAPASILERSRAAAAGASPSRRKSRSLLTKTPDT